jgi:hypothetical protein
VYPSSFMTCSVMMFIDVQHFTVVASTRERRQMQCHSSSPTMPGVFDVTKVWIRVM